jgi:hypothetical protein
MSTIGKNLSFVKRKLTQERNPNVISRTIVFMHEASGFSTLIDLNSLTVPSDASANGFTNPGIDTINFLSFSRHNVQIESSYKGELIDYEDYVIVNNTQINLLPPNTTEPGEVFVITITLPNNVDLKSLIDNLNTPLYLLNQALYGVPSLLRFSASNLNTQVLNILQYVSTKNREENPIFVDVTETPSGSYPGSEAFHRGVLLPDGRIFLVPNNSTTARIYNPVTNTITTPSGSYPGSFAFYGGVLLPDGRVFLVPSSSTTARIYNPITDTTTTPSGTYPGAFSFAGGVLLPDGRVFLIPRNSTTARIYNPATDTLTTPSGTYPGSSAFYGGVLLTDGRVFIVPNNSTTARIYDPATDTVTTPNGTYFFSNNNDFASGVLLQDGRVLIIPQSSPSAVIYDPITNTIKTLSTTFPGSAAFSGGVPLPDGRVFMVPLNSTTARIYDPVTDTVTTPSGTYPGSTAFVGGVLLPDGRVFCIPGSSTTARIFSGSFSKHSNRFQFPINVMLSTFLNKL